MPLNEIEVDDDDQSVRDFTFDPADVLQYQEFGVLNWKIEQVLAVLLAQNKQEDADLHSLIRELKVLHRKIEHVATHWYERQKDADLHSQLVQEYAILLTKIEQDYEVLHWMIKSIEENPDFNDQLHQNANL